MPLTTTLCSHCGTPFAADGTTDFYSIRVDSNGYLLEVLDGELVPGALHYCSQDCMFKREQGVTPELTVFKFLGFGCETP